MASTKLHFKEINLVLYFPSHGNEGRSFPKYGVAFHNRQSGETQPGVRINLERVLDGISIKEHYPHSVSLFMESTGKGRTWSPQYLESRTVTDVDELFHWLEEIRV